MDTGTKETVSSKGSLRIRNEAAGGGTEQVDGAVGLPGEQKGKRT